MSVRIKRDTGPDPNVGLYSPLGNLFVNSEWQTKQYHWSHRYDIKFGVFCSCMQGGKIPSHTKPRQISKPESAPDTIRCIVFKTYITACCSNFAAYGYRRCVCKGWSCIDVKKTFGKSRGSRHDGTCTYTGNKFPHEALL